MEAINGAVISELNVAIERLVATVEALQASRTASEETSLKVVQNAEGLYVPEEFTNDAIEQFAPAERVNEKMTKAVIIEKYNKLADAYDKECSRHRRFMKLFSMIAMSRPSRSEYDAFKKEHSDLRAKYVSLYNEYVKLKDHLHAMQEASTSPEINKDDLELVSLLLLEATNKPAGLMEIDVRKARNMIKQLLRKGKINITHRKAISK